LEIFISKYNEKKHLLKNPHHLFTLIKFNFMRIIYLALFIFLCLNQKNYAQTINFNALNPGTSGTPLTFTNNDIVKFDYIGVNINSDFFGVNGYLRLKEIEVKLAGNAGTTGTTVKFWVRHKNEFDGDVYVNLGSMNIAASTPAFTSNFIFTLPGSGYNIPIGFDTDGAYGYIDVGIQFTNINGYSWIAGISPGSTNFVTDNNILEYNTFNHVATNVASPNAYMSMRLSGIANNSLPIELKSFSAKKTQDNKALLTWETASELNNEGFIIEKSKDGKHFSSIGFVKGTGNSTIEQHYDFYDNAFNEGAYYRLKQKDFDGKTAYTKSVFVENKYPTKGKSLAYPNPSNGNFFIDHSSDIVHVSLVNMLGQVVFQTPSSASEKTEIRAESLPSGHYRVILRGGKNQIESIPIFIKTQ
jgi:Secretion system C-terminal sorting domain